MKKTLNLLLVLILAVTLVVLPFNNNVMAMPDDDLGESEDKKIAGSADIVFVIDSTGSMGDYIASVKDNLTNFVNSLDSKGVSLNMSVIEYRDIWEDGASSTIYHDIDGSKWTSDVDKIIDVFNSISVDGGGDKPETPIDAFEKMYDFEKKKFNFPREDSSKFVFLLSDASYKDYEDTKDNHNNNHYSMNAWTEEFRSCNIKVTVVSQNEYEEDYNYLYTMTGGRFIDINTENYYELMQEYSEWIYENSIDSDGDGLPDDWEINGVDTNHDGVIDLNLSAMGADPNVPDIFIEADWMEYEGDDFDFLWIHEKRNQKNTAPSALALKKVYDQFNSHGIKVHIDAGPNSIMNYDTGETWGDLSGASALTYQDIFYLGSNFENWNKIAIDNFTKARWTTFKYCLFVNQYDAEDGNGNTSSGIAENIPAQFFIVASGGMYASYLTGKSSIKNWDTALAGTIMHELGHTLGLSHGGLYFDDSTAKVTNNHDNHKPNHLSIMNYNYQFSGLKTVLGDFVVDYQDFKLPQIDEDHVDESRGIDPEGATAGKGLTIRIPVVNKFLWWNSEEEKDADIAGQAIDFNKNGVIENDIKYNLNNDKDEKSGEDIYGTLTETLNEWNNLKFSGGLIGGYGDEINVDDITSLITKPDLDHELDELTIDDAFEQGLLGDPGECQFNDVSSKTVFSEQKNQNLTLAISNLYPEETTVKLDVSSEVLTNEYTAEIDVSEDGATVKIPVRDNLDIGSYDVTYSMTLENGKVVTETGVISVVAPDDITMEIGDTEKIPVDSVVSCESSDDSIVEIADGEIIAKSIGLAYVMVTSDIENTYCAKITVVDVGTDDEPELSDEPSNKPSEEPSEEPSKESSEELSEEPSEEPSVEPSNTPSEESSKDESDSLIGGTDYDNTGKTPPQTGDSNNITLLLFVTLSLSLIVLSGIVIKRKYKK